MTVSYTHLGACREDLVLLGAMPTITPPMWTTLSTGAYASTHCITGFWNTDPLDRSKLIYALDSTMCKAEQVWKMCIRDRAYTAPVDVKDLEDAIEKLAAEKEAAVMSQEYEKAAEIRDQEQKKRSELNAAKEQWKNETKMCIRDRYIDCCWLQ